jgi:outer membrane protein OmpA-like peptidoglycan-associated protein
MGRVKVVFAVIFCAALAAPAFSQYTDTGFEVGAHGGATYDQSTGIKKVTPGINGGLDLAFPLFPVLQLEASGSYAELRSDSTLTLMGLGDLKLKLAAARVPGFIPYIFAGGGAIKYRHDDQRRDSTIIPPRGSEKAGWLWYMPGGAGFQIKIYKGTAIDFRGTYNYVFSPHLTPDPDKDDDAFFTAQVGLRVGSGPPNRDVDNDGLLNRDEKRLGTNLHNPDTDGDGLKDGEEYATYKTNPLVSDTDGDGLSDGAEVRTYRTDPLKTDTDGDGLTDGDEVTQYHTDPLKTDTDDDGLGDREEIVAYHTDPLKTDTDGDGLVDRDEVTIDRTDPLKADTDDDGIGDREEIMAYHTDPDKADTDGDLLSDGDEINRHTDPLKMDTDGGTVADGLEVERGSNPLNPSDDVPKPKPPVLVLEKNKAIVLPGILFESNKAVIKPESEAILIQAYNALNENTEIEVEIGGHTDAVGSDAANDRLSQRRADSVRQWLVNKGVAPNRLRSVGYGESRPIATNETEEGRALNRRIEFTRTK